MIGTIVSLLTAAYQRRRANHDKERDRQGLAAASREEFRKQIMAKVSTSYVAAKRARRLLRARGLSLAPGATTEKPRVVPRRVR